MNHNNKPIFVVGVPRSGTTLLAAMLASHSRLSCGTETRFFRFLNKDIAEKICNPKTWPLPAIEYLFSLKLVGKSVPEHYTISIEEIEQYLLPRPPKVSTVLSALTEINMVKSNKLRWVEKSPEHLRDVIMIRSYFPASPIVRILRDPRDVALSIQKPPWGPKNDIDAFLLWREYDDRSWDFFHNDLNCFSIYYHDLICDPKSTLKTLCDYLGEHFEEQMLNTSQAASLVTTSSDTWHRIVDKPVDKDRIDVWKKEMNDARNRAAEAIIGDRLLMYGFSSIVQFNQLAELYPPLFQLRGAVFPVEYFAEKQIKFWGKTNEDVDCLIFCGEPTSDKWLSQKKPERWLDFLKICLKCVLFRSLGKNIYWVRPKSMIDNEKSIAGKIIKKLLRSISITVWQEKTM